jgi:hypothetical protein
MANALRKNKLDNKVLLISGEVNGSKASLEDLQRKVEKTLKSVYQNLNQPSLKVGIRVTLFGSTAKGVVSEKLRHAADQTIEQTRNKAKQTAKHSHRPGKGV